MKGLGLALTILGVVALVYGGITYKREKTILDVGLLKATTTEKRNIPLSPIAGAIATAGGLLLLVIPRRGNAS